MARKREFIKEPDKSKHIKFMLYPDNEQHLQVLEKIKDDKFPYIGISHHIIDFDGNPVTEGSGKPHYHVYQEYPNQVYPTAVAKRYGMIDDSGKVSVQFCRTIAGRWHKALQYLTHLNDEEKEPYSKHDLFGWDSLKREYDLAELEYFSDHIDIRTALFAMKDWVCRRHAGDIITTAMMIDWLLDTPYIRFRNERLWLELIKEHNQRIWALEAKNRIEGFAQGSISLSSRSVGSDIDFSEMSDEEYESLGLGLYGD